VDLFDRKVVSHSPATPPTFPRTEWRFDGPAPSPATAARPQTRGWEALAGVAGLAIRDGRLAGRSTTDMPLLHIERRSGLGDRDQLHAIEIRMRVSGGANLAVETSSEPKLDVPRFIERTRAFAWEIKTPIQPGDETRTYTLTKKRPLPAADIRHLVIRPTDAAGADFTIESVRLILRKEYLAGVASGAGFQGMGEIYREALVSRSPERLRFPLHVPAGSRLDLALGVIDDQPVTFRVTLERIEGDREAQKALLLEQTLTTPYRWETRQIELDAYAGANVTLVLALSAERAGAIGVWGSPVVRSRGAPVAQDARPDAFPASAGLIQPPQGVILLWADTLRRDHLDVYGHGRPTSPVLRRMAREGALFRHHVSQATWTKVSTPSLVTSLYPSTHGVREFADRLPAAATTLAEVYRAGGYATVSFASNLFTGQFTNLHQGYEELHEEGSLPDQASSKTSREYVDRLLTWLERHRDVPFFAFVHLYDPHDPYEPRPPYDSRWADPARKEEHARQAKRVKEFIAEPLAKAFGMPTRDELLKAGIDPEAFVSHDRDWYDGSILGMDAEIGRILERLRALGLDRQTMVVFTGVPLVVRWPGVVPAGRVVDETTATIDVMPTLLDASRLPHPKGLQGQSLVPFLRSDSRRGGGAGAAEAAQGDNAEATRRGRDVPPAGWTRRPAVSEKARTAKDSGAPPPHEADIVSIVDDRWKLIHNRTRPGGEPEFELYDRDRDPLDRQDVAARHPEEVRRLAKQLENWRKMVETARLEPDTELMKGLTQQQLERLRSLGYIK
jgi:arylsulfatase A-like enzyme